MIFKGLNVHVVLYDKFTIQLFYFVGLYDGLSFSQKLLVWQLVHVVVLIC